MGGVAVYLGFALAATILLPLSPPVLGVLAGGLAAVAVGVLDERLTLPPGIHLAGQVAAAGIAMVSGVGVLRSISLPTSGLNEPGLQLPVAVGIVVTVVWLVGMMNTINFLDGMDGLATGISALAALLLAAWALERHGFQIAGPAHHEDFILPVALAGSLFGFLPYNWHQARIFLGDSGSMFLGLALGTLSIVGPAKLGTALVVLMIPILDVAWAIVRRQLQGRSFLAGDKQHVYHRMLELGMGHTSVVLLLYFLVSALAVLDLVLFKFAKLVAFVVLAAAVGTVFILLEVRASRRRASDREIERGELRGL
jgi:UDP-GlcNAc:undecaprenyl-phosphate GlcNAc-1-phosphate transferase